MKKHCFYFLGDSFADICNEAMFCEKHLVEGNYKDSIFRAGMASEKITITICEFADLDFISPSQKKRLETLLYNGIIGSDMKKILNDIREIRNKAAHGYLTDLEENASKVHLYLYIVCTYFYKEYFDSNFSFEDYCGPIMGSGSKSGKISVESSNDNENIQDINTSSLEDYPFEKYNNSYLLNELSKLNVSSIEAVENDNLSEFKEYLHVDRPIQDDFLKAVKKVANSNSSHLIMLCGSVGDGKTHLISNLVKQDDFGLFDDFEINYDATESFDQDKNEIETLVSELEAFNDENIKNSSKKLILAINLGVLNNFVESDYIGEFDTLNSIIAKSNILEPNTMSNNIYGEKVSFITFSDYNMFELNDDVNSNYVSSEYISDLFAKITQKTDDNPFYVAYHKDKKSEFISPIIYNYEMLMDEEIQKIIIDYLIKIFIKYKKIISTRKLLNFIYEIVVPPESLKIEELDNINDFMAYSLPNLLFNSPNSSDLLELINQLDPTLIRNEELDTFIIDLNIKGDLGNLLNDYFDFREMEFFENYFMNIDDFKGKSMKEKQELTSSLIRFALFYGKNSIKNNFKDETYEKFLKYLYAYNSNKIDDYNLLLKEIKEAIFMLRGFYNQYICVDRLKTFKVYKYFKIIPIIEAIQNPLIGDGGSSNRFKTEIGVKFSVSHSNENVSLNIDYSLYEYILKLQNGFKPNKNDNENLINLNDFINKLLNLSDEGDLKIKDLENDNTFSFTFDGFDRFEIKREN